MKKQLVRYTYLQLLHVRHTVSNFSLLFKDFPDVEEMSNEKINGVIVIDADKHVKSEETSAPRKFPLRTRAELAIALTIRPNVGTTWPKEKLDRLINQMEATLPKNDTLKYSSRLGRLDWKAVGINNSLA